MSTWYVRPDTSHSGTRNGTSYATAWGGWSEITWGGGGVVGGDTLYVCGAHAYSAASIAVGAHTGSAEASRCTIRGDYAADPGSITFTGARFLENARNWTTITGLTITAGTSNCLFISGGTDCVYSNNTLSTTNSVALALYGESSFSRVTITGNAFSGDSVTGSSGGFIRWLVTSTGVTKTLTNITISDNTFTSCTSGRSIIHLRTENDTNIASVMTGIVISGNTFTGCRGVCIEAFHGHDTANIGGTLSITSNTATDCLATASDADVGGMISVKGFSSGTISENVCTRVSGAAGFCNVFYGGYAIKHNIVNGLTAGTIDACGILFDVGVTQGLAQSNLISNLSVGASNSVNYGYGVMVLAATNVVVTGNLFINVMNGVGLGDAGAGQSATIANNTFANVAYCGVFANVNASLSTVTLKNNVFTGGRYSVYDDTVTAWSSEDYNYFYSFSSGTFNHTLGAQSITTDPLLDASYRLTASSPCRDAGTFIADARHFSGGKLDRTPDIGAKRYVAERAAVSPLRTAVSVHRSRVSTFRDAVTVARI